MCINLGSKEDATVYGGCVALRPDFVQLRQRRVW